MCKALGVSMPAFFQHGQVRDNFLGYVSAWQDAVCREAIMSIRRGPR